MIVYIHIKEFDLINKKSTQHNSLNVFIIFATIILWWPSG